MSVAGRDLILALVLVASALTDGMFLPSVLVSDSLAADYSDTDYSDTDYLETVVVTAQRDEIPLRDATQTVTIIDSGSLQRINADHMYALMQQAAGTWVSRGSGQEHLTAIRSPIFTGAGACGAFQMSQDGIPLRASGFCNANQLFDSHYEAAAAVEVQRGPNSALYGSNALFGTVDVRLPRPMAADGSAVSLDISTQDFYRLKVAAPFAVSNDKGWLALATFTDNTDERVSAGYQQQKISLKQQAVSGSRHMDSSLSFTHLNQQTAGYVDGEEAYKNDRLRLENSNPEAYRKATSVRGSHRWQWQSRDAKWSLMPYFRYADMEFLMHFVPWQPVENNRHGSLGAQLQTEHFLSPSVALRFGLDLEMTQAQLSEVQSDQAPFDRQRIPVGAHYDYAVDAQMAALLGGVEWRPSEPWLFNVNLRGDHQQYHYRTAVAAGSACDPAVTGCRFYRPADRQDAFNNPSIALGARYFIAPTHSLFANMATGFRAPQAAELYRLQQGQDLAELDSVKLHSLEWGWRGSVAGIDYQTALFYMNLENGIFQDSNRANVSGAKSQHKGLEYELKAKLGNGITLQLAGSFAEHTYSNNPNLLGSTANIQGNLIDTAPKNTHAFVIGWRANAMFNGFFEVSRLGRYFIDPENTLSYPGHTLANLRASWSINKNLTLNATLFNLFDARYADLADVAFGEQRYFPGQSRHGMLSITWAD
jgi:iron complex outermembrane recepter protein